MLKLIGGLVALIYISCFVAPLFANCGHCKEGKCPQAQSKKTIYACPTEKCPYHSGKPGECKHCKKGLVKSDVVFKCPKCGMKFDKQGKCTMDGEKLVPEITKPKAE